MVNNHHWFVQEKKRTFQTILSPLTSQNRGRYQREKGRGLIERATREERGEKLLLSRLESNSTHLVRLQLMDINHVFHLACVYLLPVSQMV